MSLRQQATAGLVWTFAQQFGNQLVGFAISLVLARILLPEEFGLIGMITVFVAIGNTIMNGGLTQSLIRQKELDEQDFSTVFYFNLLASIIVYILLYFSAPLIASFYDKSILSTIIRVYSITFIISSFGAVQLARLTKKMNFKRQTMISIPATILGGVSGIIMAYSGYGVWSLVWSQVITNTARTVQLWIYSKWLPQWKFSFTKFKDHFNFGYKLTLSSLLETIFANLYLVVIGKFFTASQVGFYTRAETMKQLPVTNISSALNKVTYPLFASIQEDDERLKRVYKQLMQSVVFVISPIMVLIAVLAEPLFRFLFTEKWLPAVPYFQILCITGILYPIHAYNLNVLNVKGRSDLYLKLEVIKKTIIVITIVIALQFGILALLYGQVITSIIAFIVNTHYTGRFIKYTAWQQSKDVLPIIFFAAISGFIIYFFDLKAMRNLTDILRIIAGGFLGILIYLSFGYFFQNDLLENIKKIVLKR